MFIPFIALAFQAFAVSTPLVANNPDVGAMTPRDIKMHNADLAKDDPEYIRCKRFLETGSLIKTINICRTNRSWTVSVQNGNQNARDTLDAMSSKSGQNPE